MATTTKPFRMQYAPSSMTWADASLRRQVEGLGKEGA